MYLLILQFIKLYQTTCMLARFEVTLNELCFPPLCNLEFGGNSF